MPRLDWYFDFVSPYAYPQFAGYPDLLRRPDVELKPILFAGLLDHWGHKGPAEIPAKRLQTYRQVLWQAAQRGIPMRVPPAHPFNPIHVLRLAVALGSTYGAIKAIFDFIWAEGRDPNAEMASLAERLGVTDVNELTRQPEVKARLRANGEEALAVGLYGVPTFVVTGTPDAPQLFWGVDATGMLLAYLKDPAMFDTPEMRRIAALPVAADRLR